jgi:hypothetical protein
MIQVILQSQSRTFRKKLLCLLNQSKHSVVSIHDVYDIEDGHPTLEGFKRTRPLALEAVKRPLADAR